MIPLLLALLAPPERPPEPAWSFDIHRLICDIAWRELNAGARAEVERLLSLDAEQPTFAESCVWADQVRRDSAYRWTAPAHYVNAPRGAAGIDVARDCANICVVTAVPQFAAVLADRTQSDSARIEALKFVGHFVGDLHQPLHAGYGDDRGGNGHPVTFRGDSVNLHWLWDGLLPGALGLTPESAGELHEAIRPVDRVRWARLDPIEWANESFAIVERQIYADVRNGEAADDYVERNRHTVIARIQAAGVRLGALLNRAVGR